MSAELGPDGKSVADSIKTSLKIESPIANGFLDSRPVALLDEAISRLYFWVDERVFERQVLDINENNGVLLNALAHVTFKLRKLIPTAKELREAGLLNIPSLTRMVVNYAWSFADPTRIQGFQDGSGNTYWALNLYLDSPSVESAASAMAVSGQRLNVILGNCSKGHLIPEAPSLTSTHVCPYRIDKRCFYTNGSVSVVPPEKSPFYPCHQQPCLVGHLHQTVRQEPEDQWPRFTTILGGVQTFREIPSFFDMNTTNGEPQSFIWATCKFSVPYLIQVARMFPNVQGLVLSYDNGCRTLCDRIIRLRGKRRDEHITRFKGDQDLGKDPISAFLKTYKDYASRD